MGKSFQIPTVYTAVDKASAVLNKIKHSMRNFPASAEAGVARAERLFRRFTPVLSESTSQMLAFTKAAAIAGAILAGITFTFSEVKAFDKSLASLRSITGQTTAEFAPMRAKIIEVAKAEKKLSTQTAEAFGKIASLNSTFLESAASIGSVSKATILLSKASGDELGPSAENLVSIMNQFNQKAHQANSTVNVLAAGAGVGAASIVQTSESFKNFGSVAASSNITLEESVALIQVMGKFSVFGAEAGTKLRGSVLKLKQAGVGYASGQFNINDALEETRNKLDKLKTAKQKDALLQKLFGAENIATGQTLVNNIELFKEFTKGVTGTNAAAVQAATNMDTLSSAADEVTASWINLVTGSDKTTSSLNLVKKSLQFVSTNMETIVSIGIYVLLTFISIKTILVAARVSLVAYNIAIGVYNALFTKSLVLTNANVVAQKAYILTSKIGVVVLDALAAAQWAWNAAMFANPIGAITLAILALIGVIVVVIQKWNDWGAALSIFLGPLGIVLSVIQSIRRNWDGIVTAFKEGGIIAGIKAIGATFLDVVLMPFQQLANLLAKFTGIKAFATTAKVIEFARNRIGANTKTNEAGRRFDEAASTNDGTGEYGVKPALNPKQSQQDMMREEISYVKTFNSTLTIQDESGKAKLKNANPFITMPQIGTTMGF